MKLLTMSWNICFILLLKYFCCNEKNIFQFCKHHWWGGGGGVLNATVHWSNELLIKLVVDCHHILTVLTCLITLNVVLRVSVLVQEDYRNQNPYHNAVHAADVTQAMHCYLREPKVIILVLNVL